MHFALIIILDSIKSSLYFQQKFIYICTDDLFMSLIVRVSLPHTHTHTHLAVLSVNKTWKREAVIIQEDGLRPERHHLPIPKMPLSRPSAACPPPITKAFRVFFHSCLCFNVNLLFAFYLLLSLSLYRVQALICFVGGFHLPLIYYYI